MVNEIMEKSKNFTKFSEKLKFFDLKRFNMPTSYLRSFGILST